MSAATSFRVSKYVQMLAGCGSVLSGQIIKMILCPLPNFLPLMRLTLEEVMCPRSLLLLNEKIIKTIKSSVSEDICAFWHFSYTYYIVLYLG